MHKYKTNTGSRERATYYCQRFKCEDCERFFKSEKKLEDHERFNAMFEMDDSDKIYKYEGLLNKICSSIFKCKICECEAKGKNKLNSFKGKTSNTSICICKPKNKKRFFYAWEW